MPDLKTAHPFQTPQKPIAMSTPAPTETQYGDSTPKSCSCRCFERYIPMEKEEAELFGALYHYRNLGGTSSLFLTVASWIGISTVASLFLWARAAGLFGKDPPSLSGLETSEQSMLEMVDANRCGIEDAIRWVFHIAVDRDFLVFSRVITCLWILSLVGSCVDFLTLLCIGILIGLMIPVTYLKYEDGIKACAERVKMIGRRCCEKVKMGSRKLYGTVDEKILGRIKKKGTKEKRRE